MARAKAAGDEPALDRNLVPLLRNTAKVFIIIVAILVTAQNLGVNTTSVLASLTIGGLVLFLAGSVLAFGDVADAIRKTMQAHCGVFRTGALLSQGKDRILEIDERVQHVAIADRSKVFNTARVEALELDNLIEVARSSMVSAEARKESRGAHDRADFPNRDDQNWLKHTLWFKDGDRLEYKPVTLKPMTAETIEPKVRTY